MTTGMDKELLRQLLQVSGNWEVSDYQLDLRKQRFDVWVGPRVERGWFGRPKAPPPTETHSWQHVSLGGVRFVVHVRTPFDADLDGLSWTGDMGMPFTHALAHQVFHMFNEGMELAAICKLLNLQLNDVWRYRFALDNGLVQRDGVPTPRPAAATQVVPVPAVAQAAARAVAAEAASSERVPDVTDPIWLRLVNGDIKLDNLMVCLDDPAVPTAVLDWDMCTRGDVLADLGTLLNYCVTADDPLIPDGV